MSVSAAPSGCERTTCRRTWRGKVSDVDQGRRRARADGEGSLYRRSRLGPDGKPYLRWVAQISLGGRDDRRIVRRICPTKSDAKAALVELLRPAEPVPPQREQPLGAYLRRWLDESAAPSLSPSTLRGYRDALAHLAPIADIPIGELQPEDIERALAGMTTRRAHAKKQDAGITQDRPQRPDLPPPRPGPGRAAWPHHPERREARPAAPGAPPSRRRAHPGTRQGHPRRRDGRPLRGRLRPRLLRPAGRGRSWASPGPTSTRAGRWRPSATSSQAQARGRAGCSSRPLPRSSRCRSRRS